MMECSCYKEYVCELCKQWKLERKYGKMFKEVRKLIQRYPLEVRELINAD